MFGNPSHSGVVVWPPLAFCGILGELNFRSGFLFPTGWNLRSSPSVSLVRIFSFGVVSPPLDGGESIGLGDDDIGCGALVAVGGRGGLGLDELQLPREMPPPPSQPP